MEDIFSFVQQTGFYESARRGLFLLDKNATVSPGYYSVILRKSGAIRFGGGVGLYFREFETNWYNSLNKEERKLDCTLPLIMDISNFALLLDENVFRYTRTKNEWSAAVNSIYRLCSQLPRSIDDFSIAAMKCLMLEIGISDFIHINPLFEDDSLYYRKSRNFLEWLRTVNPVSYGHIINCLSDFQRSRLR